MTLFAPDDLPLDDLLKLENRLREISALGPSAPHEPSLARSSTQASIVANQAVEQAAIESTNGVSNRLLSELEELTARSAKAEPPSQSLASRLLSKFRPDR